MFLFYFNLLVDGLTGSMLGKIRYDPTIGYRMSDVGCRYRMSAIGCRCRLQYRIGRFVH